MTFKLKFPGGKKCSHVNVWSRSGLGMENSKFKCSTLNNAWRIARKPTCLGQNGQEGN